MTGRKALILAGGRGARLSPITDFLPKPLVPVAGKAVISHILSNLYKAGIKDAAVTLGYGAAEIRRYFEKNGTEGVNLVFFEESEPLGTAGGAYGAKEFFDGDFVTLGGDVVFDFDLSPVFEYHRERGATATVVLTHSADPCGYGTVVADKDGKIVDFAEKPTWRRVKSDEISTGIYVFSPRIFDFIEGGRFSDFAKDVFPSLVGGAFYAYKTDGYFCDIGTPASYLTANIDARRGAICGIGGSGVSHGAKVSETAHISNSVIMDGAAVGGGATVDFSIVCPDAVLMKNSVSKFAVVAPGFCVPTGCTAHTNAGLESAFSGENVAGRVKAAASAVSAEAAEEIAPEKRRYTVTGTAEAPLGSARTVGEMMRRGAERRDEGVRLVFDDGYADICCIDKKTVEISASSHDPDRAGELFDYAKNGAKNLF